MISVPDGTGDIPCGYDICYADDICFAYDGNGYYIIFADANISYGVSRISYRVSDISLKRVAFYDMLNSKAVILCSPF